MCSHLLIFFFNHEQHNVLIAIVFSFSFALCCPYKNSCFNAVDCLFHAILALGVFLLIFFRVFISLKKFSVAVALYSIVVPDNSYWVLFVSKV